MALAYGEDTTSNFTTQLNPSYNIGGVNVFVHGGDIASREHASLQRHLRSLTKDYPDIIGSQGLSELHIHNTLEGDIPELSFNAQQAYGRIQAIAEFGNKNALENYAGLAIASKHGTGTISMNMPAVRLQAGRQNEELTGSIPYTSVYTRSHDPELLSLMQEGYSELEEPPLQATNSNFGWLLEHEFGHHVQFHLAARHYPDITTEEGQVALQHTEQVEPLLQKHFSNYIPEDQQMELATQIMAKHGISDKNMDALSEEDPIKFQRLLEMVGNEIEDTVDIVGSRYSLTNTKELFAETFTRGRMRGVGKGAKEAAAWEQDIRQSVRTSSKSSKMLRSTKSAIKGLLDMRR